MSKTPDSPLDAETRAQVKRWLDNWARVGPILDEERYCRIAALTDAEAARMALDLWRFAIPGRGDDGEGLMPLKQLPIPDADRSRR